MCVQCGVVGGGTHECPFDGASFVKMTIKEKGSADAFYNYQMNNVCELNLTDVVVVDNSKLESSVETVPNKK